MQDDTTSGESFATHGPSPSEHATSDYSTPRTKSGSGQLEVRCPNCRIPVQVAADTSFTDLTCSVCGSHFSLVDHENATWLAPPLARLGRFELLERLGVGGYGTVWKARDQQLDRIVALKLPRRTDMDAVETESFFKEARAAAQLRHPNIVSVHEVGRDGDSVYIVSDFVRGVTLGEWLTGQQLTNREAAELCAKIADALQHAHENGVVHRDLKPANIMINGDGQPHLMDFGLARRAAGEITMTVDGQILGTPAYMSPEQAQGEAHAADARSDVYSLGVILFQLLTGELPFRGSARMLLHQVIHDPAPSPRKFRANIPKNLETITLKCLEKTPARRYQSAVEVKDELQRFLKGEPIHARPIGRVERAWQWCRRYPQVAALSALLLLALVAGTAISTTLAVKAQRNAEQFRQERDRAEDNLQLAESAVEDFLTQVAEDERLKQEDLYALRKNLLQGATTFYERFAKQKPGDADREANRANAYVRLARIRSETGDSKKALDELRQAVAIQLTLVDQYPDRPSFRYDLAESEKALAWSLHLRTERTEAEKHYRKALDLFTQLSNEYPDDTAYRMGVATTRNAYGMSLRWHNSKAGREQFELAIKEQQLLRDKFPDVTEYRRGYAGSLFLLGHLLRNQDPTTAQRNLEEAVTLQRDLVSQNPKVTGYRSALSDTVGVLAQVKEKLKDFDGAGRQHEESIAIAEQLIRDFPAVVRNRVILVGAHSRYGEFLGRIKDRDGAIAEQKKGVRVYEQLVAENPEALEYRLGLASTHFVCAYTSYFRDKDEARACYEQAVAVCEKAVEDFPDEQIAKSRLTTYRRRLAAMLSELGRVDDAQQAFKKSLVGEEESPRWLNDFAWALATSPIDNFRDGKRAVELATQACELTNFENPALVDTLAAAYAESGDFDSAVTWSEKALALVGESDAERHEYTIRLDRHKARKPTRESRMWPGQPLTTSELAAYEKRDEALPKTSTQLGTANEQVKAKAEP